MEFRSFSKENGFPRLVIFIKKYILEGYVDENTYLFVFAKIRKNSLERRKVYIIEYLYGYI